MGGEGLYICLLHWLANGKMIISVSKLLHAKNSSLWFCIHLQENEGLGYFSELKESQN